VQGAGRDSLRATEDESTSPVDASGLAKNVKFNRAVQERSLARMNCYWSGGV
jgi:hypothetical protein